MLSALAIYLDKKKMTGSCTLPHFYSYVLFASKLLLLLYRGTLLTGKITNYLNVCQKTEIIVKKLSEEVGNKVSLFF